MIWKALTILVLLAAIAGGTGYFVYESYVKPKKLDAMEQAQASLPPPPPPPDPSVAAFEAVKPQLGLETPEAREALKAFLAQYPDKPGASEVREALGRMNSALVLSQAAGPDKVSYSVVSGDALVKIAAKFKTNAELIYRVNGLSTINLKIGQQLVIPQLDVSVIVDRAANAVVVQNHGEFFKAYPVRSLKIPGTIGAKGADTKVNDKFVMKGTGRIAFGSKDFESGDRWIMLGTSGVAIRGEPAPDAEGKTPPAPPGILLSQDDAAELFVLVSRGTPVTIR